MPEPERPTRPLDYARRAEMPQPSALQLLIDLIAFVLAGVGALMMGVGFLFLVGQLIQFNQSDLFIALALALFGGGLFYLSHRLSPHGWRFRFR